MEYTKLETDEDLLKAGLLGVSFIHVGSARRLSKRATENEDEGKSRRRESKEKARKKKMTNDK